MPNKYDELEGHVTAVEHELRRVREDATAARVLVREADRDVSEFGVKLDAHTKTLNALRETQLEMQSRLTLFERKVDDGTQVQRPKARVATSRAAVVLVPYSITRSERDVAW